MAGYFVGVDVGSITTKVVIVSDEGNFLGSATIPTGFSVAKATDQALDQALKSASLNSDSINRIVATGYGRNLVTFANEKITEITCHAKGAYKRIGKALTLIDIGGQDSKVITINNSGKVDKFLMNDKCSAGTGRFLDVMARALDTDLENFSSMALNASSSAKINSMCTVFAETEVISLIARGTSREEIAYGLCLSIAERVGSMVKKVGFNDLIFVSGGVAYNQAVVSALSSHLQKKVTMLEEPQINGAFGAALLAIQLPS